MKKIEKRRSKTWILFLDRESSYELSGSWENLYEAAQWESPEEPGPVSCSCLCWGFDERPLSLPLSLTLFFISRSKISERAAAQQYNLSEANPFPHSLPWDMEEKEREREREIRCERVDGQASQVDPTFQDTKKSREKFIPNSVTKSSYIFPIKRK